MSWGRVMPAYTAGGTAVHAAGLMPAFLMQSQPGEGGAMLQDTGPIPRRMLEWSVKEHLEGTLTCKHR